MRKINWGVMGTAGIAKSCTIPGMQKAENCNLYAIAGRKEEKVKAYQQEFGFEKAYVGYDAMLDDPAVEAVYIPLSNDLHREWSIRAMKKGKHVLCEKPLGVTPAQMREMMDAARENGVYLMEAFAYLHSPLIAAVKAEIKAGAIGEVAYMDTAFITSKLEPQNIRMRRETFGGSVYDVGCYNTSLILWMFEEMPKEIQAVGAFTEQKIDIHAAAQMEFASGKRASFTCGMCLDGGRIDRFSIYGSRGYIKCEEEFNANGELSYRICTDGKEEVRTVKAPHNYMLEVEQFGRCIADGEEPHVSHAFTLENGELLERVLKEIHYSM